MLMQIERKYEIYRPRIGYIHMYYVMYVVLVLGLQNEIVILSSTIVPKKGAPFFTFIVKLFMAWLDDTNVVPVTY